MEVIRGLENVIVAETNLSYIDGQKGALYYSGYRIEDLAEHCSFEEVAYLLFKGHLPTKSELGDFKNEINQRLDVPENVWDLYRSLPKDTRPTHALLAGVGAIAAMEDEPDIMGGDSPWPAVTRLLAVVPQLAGGWFRIRQGLDPVPARAEFNYAENFWRALFGKLSDNEEVIKIFNSMMILHAEHGLNASAFAARVAASTLSDPFSAICAGIGTLKGPLHGRANEEAMRMFEEIGDPDKAEEYVKKKLEAKQRIMGFGHRVYKTEDPRAKILRGYARRIGEILGDTRWIEIAEAVRAAMEKLKPNLHPNVDFYSPTVFRLIGLPRDMYPVFFGVSRNVGWLAHVLEQYAANRLIRPRAKFVGELDKKFIPLEER